MLRTLPPFNMGPVMEDRAPSPLPPLGHDISRPSSTSTQNSLHRHQSVPNLNGGGIALPGLSALASVASGTSPQMRAYNGLTPSPHYSTASPTPTSVGGQGNNPPVCQNCTTSTTPLWRRDEIGSVLCNACGLFLKLHGRPRPISLKTDVIKSRNRVKSSGQGQKKKSLFNGSGASTSRSEAGTPPPGYRRVSQKSSGTSERSNSPISRTTTPAIHHPSSLPQAHIFDNGSLNDHSFHHSPSLPSLHLRQPSPGGSVASHTDRRLELPHTYESLHQANATHKTRINELEVINDLYKGDLERSEAVQSQLRRALEQSEQREVELSRRLDDLEREVMQLRRGSGTGIASAEVSPRTILSTKRRYDEITSDVPPQGPHPAVSRPMTPLYAKRSRTSDISEPAEPPRST